MAFEAHKSFDNNDTKVFGNANWRAAYATWFPQRTQVEAAKLSETDDTAKLGERRHYEAKYMQNPLAAAAIIALAGNDTGHDAVERAIRHYDYAETPHGDALLRGMRVLRAASREMIMVDATLASEPMQ